MLADRVMRCMTAWHMQFTGRKVRYVYASTMSTGPLVRFDRLVKYDLAAPIGRKVVGLIDHGGPRYVGGEAFFVPRTGGPVLKCGEVFLPLLSRLPCLCACPVT